MNTTRGADMHVGVMGVLAAILISGAPPLPEVDELALMTAGAPRHIRTARHFAPGKVATITDRLWPAPVVVAAVEPAPTSSAPVVTYSSANWEAVMQCESGSVGGWSLYTTGNGYYFALQFSPSTWTGYGGPSEYLSNGQVPSKSLQIAVAERVLAGQGPEAWPNCFTY